MCKILKKKGKEFCPNTEIFMTSPRSKLIVHFMQNLQLRQDHLKQSELDRRELKVQNADVAALLACRTRV